MEFTKTLNNKGNIDLIHSKQMFKFALQVAILPVDVLAANAERASAGKIVTQSAQNIQGSSLQGLISCKPLEQEVSWEIHSY